MTVSGPQELVDSERMQCELRAQVRRSLTDVSGEVVTRIPLVEMADLGSEAASSIPSADFIEHLAARHCRKSESSAWHGGYDAATESSFFRRNPALKIAQAAG
jgi:hypothetical protein